MVSFYITLAVYFFPYFVELYYCVLVFNEMGGERIMSFCTTTAMRVAEYIITKSYENRTPVSNLKLQKLLYFVQGQAIKVYGERAFTESIEAWDYGPVVRSVYLKFRIFGAGPICREYPVVSLTDETKDSCEYAIAQGYLVAGEYEQAQFMFAALDNFRDSAQMVKECIYLPALELFEEGKYDEAAEIFRSLGLYSDSANRYKDCRMAVADHSETEAVFCIDIFVRYFDVQSPAVSKFGRFYCSIVLP